MLSPMTPPPTSLADRAPRGTLTPGTLSAPRHVPGSIERPEYLFHDGPERVDAPEVKDAATIELIRQAGRIAARAMEEAGAAVAPGVTTSMVIKGLEPGEYAFFDDFHPDAPPAVLVAK